MWWWSPQIGLFVGRQIRKRMDHQARVSSYDPVYDVISNNEESIHQAGRDIVHTITQNPGVLTATAKTAASRIHPAVAAGMITYDLYKASNWFETRYPGKAKEWFHYQLSAYTDARRYWSGDYDFDTYSVKGESWRRYHKQKTQVPYRGVNPHEFM